TMYFGYALAVSERWNFDPKVIKSALEIASDAMYSALGRLCDELLERDHFVEGDGISDSFVYRVRMTRLLGLMGIYGLWRKQRPLTEDQESRDARDVFVREWSKKFRKLIQLWGEHAVPDILAFYFYYRTIDPTQDQVGLLVSIIQGILQQNGNGQGKLADPYYDPERILPYVLHLERNRLHDSFVNSSYTLESLVHLFVRLNYKQTLKELFPALTRMWYHTLEFDEPWHFYMYRIKRESGCRRTSEMQPPHSWKQIRARADEANGNSLPPRLKVFPFHYLCLISTYPHRMNSDGIRWISTRLDEMGLG
ncbi:MAG: hypothetical protein KGM43_17420, partial [Planctomycetota bacterium]|nr:hypothetical protein [Planctomycetota bacterium]